MAIITTAKANATEVAAAATTTTTATATTMVIVRGRAKAGEKAVGKLHHLLGALVVVDAGDVAALENLVVSPLKNNNNNNSSGRDCSYC